MAERISILESEALFESGASADEAAPAEVPSAAFVERSPGLLRQVNEVMRAGRRGSAERERIPFFCECERADCYAPVWLTSDMYDERRFAQQQQPLILPGHDVATRA